MLLPLSSSPAPLALALLAAGAAGCSFDFARPTPADGRAADTAPRDDGDVPPADDGGKPRDAAASDLGAVTLSIESATGATTKACPVNTTVVGGGGSCQGGLTASAPEQNGWKATCPDGAAPSATWVVCAPEPLAKRVVRQKGACQAGEVLIGGGCACADGDTLRVSAPPNTPTATWRCECTGGKVVSFETICLSNVPASSVTRSTGPGVATCKGQIAAGGAESADPIASSVPRTPNGWSAAPTSSATATAHALCLDLP